jgi:AcrR family transcriptional regulator
MDRLVGKVLTRQDIQLRDAGAKRLRILSVAKREFSRLGLGGARIDAIAERDKVNKRTIYQYFSGKDALFTAVLETAYHDIKIAERALELEKLAPEMAIKTLVEFTWFYYLNNTEILKLKNSENLHRGRHLKTSTSMKEDYPRFTSLLQNIVARGVNERVFRTDIDIVQLDITLAAISFYYLTNSFTGSIVFERNLMDTKRLEQRLAFNIDTIQRLVRI